ncbi:MAG: RNA polymerase sigma factor [Acidobacteria bacterium]|nr:RNA polymerase sigma factor [Acidobacteriota bacterium]
MTSTPDPNQRDLELVRRFQEGDEGAFDQLVEAHRREIYRLAYRLLGNHADADDMAQEAFLRIYRSLGRFRGEASFRTWATRIVLNLVTDRRRELATHRPTSLEELGPAEHPFEAGKQGGFMQEEVLRRAVGRLPKRQRETLILRVFQEMKFQEIAAVMGCTVGTAKANFFHALRGLRQRVGS